MPWLDCRQELWAGLCHVEDLGNVSSSKFCDIRELHLRKIGELDGQLGGRDLGRLAILAAGSKEAILLMIEDACMDSFGLFPWHAKRGD